MYLSNQRLQQTLADSDECLGEDSENINPPVATFFAPDFSVYTAKISSRSVSGSNPTQANELCSQSDNGEDGQLKSPSMANENGLQPVTQ